MDAKEHESLSNITLKTQIKIKNCIGWTKGHIFSEFLRNNQCMPSYSIYVLKWKYNLLVY
jgi:hypothetical protein